MTLDNANANKPQLSGWASVMMLALAAFIFNTAEFIPVALLSDIGAGFGRPVESVGLLMTLYAWVVALVSLPLMLATRTWERRRLLVAIFLLFIVSNGLGAGASSYGLFVVSRLGVALAHAIFWAITAALVVRVAPPGQGNRALGLLALGVSLASVLGIPLGKIIGNHWGWRSSFGFIAGSAALILLALRALLPPLPAQNTGDLASVPRLLRRPTLLALFAFVVLAIGAHFTAYSYIESYGAQVVGLNPEQVSLLLLAFGLAGLGAPSLFARVYPRNSRRFFFGVTAALMGALLLLRPLAVHGLVFGLLALGWGLTIVCLNLALQAKTLQVASDATDVAMALLSGLYNIGIGGGALLGAHLIKGFGLAALGIGGALLGLLALLLCFFIKN